MNDAAELNDNIGSRAQAVDGPNQGDKDGNLDKDPNHLDPTAGVQYWRKHILPGSDVTKAVFDLRDPLWLTVINAIQLAIAIISNMFLLLNMAKRVRFSVAQPITIVGWYISAILLVALTSTASGSLVVQPEIEYVWSQAFYYGIFAAILYFIVASLMVVTVWGAQSGHYRKDFELSVSQRTLMLQTIMFLMYLLIGALVFSKIEDGWDYLDAVYWADVTLFTVGYGDFSPLSTLGRALLIPYALVGVISLGLVIGSIRSLMLDRGKRRLDARMLEKERRQLLRRMQRRGKGGMLEPIGDSGSAMGSPDADRSLSTELERRQKEFELMRRIQEKASNRKRWTAMGVSLSTWLVLWLVGAKIFQECERPYQGWSYFDAFYFCFTGLTTIGYGDLTPVSNSGKAFFVFWSLLALPTMTVLISNAGDTVVRWIRDGTLKLGNITILPGEHGFKQEFESLSRRLPLGGVFKNEKKRESPPGFLGAAQPNDSNEDEDEDEEEGDESNKSHVRGTKEAKGGGLPSNQADTQASPSTLKFLEPTHTERQNEPGSKAKKSRSYSRSNKGDEDGLALGSRVESIAREDLPSELPKTRAEYHLVLIDEIARVTKHLQHSPPRKYTFKEWAWYLRLMGQDESSAEMHKRPSRKPKRGRKHATKDDNSNVNSPQLQQTTTNATDSSQLSPLGPPSASSSEQYLAGSAVAGTPSSPHGLEDDSKWSWVGHRSPLMDTREEAEWILDRLEQRLRAELLAVVEEKRGQSGVRETAVYEHKHEYHPKKRASVSLGGD
ncbi:ion channel protein [Apiospora kogelbergensis]|uniref:Ion channel protein n=1 Tax=Apiospora kogelbergensis TaxID=1337665 RepID=A0AAW0R1C6_9PEZI